MAKLTKVYKEGKSRIYIGEWICARMDEGITFGQACTEASRRFSELKRQPERKECPMCQVPMDATGNRFSCSYCGYSASVEELRTVYNARL